MFHSDGRSSRALLNGRSIFEIELLAECSTKHKILERLTVFFTANLSVGVAEAEEYREVVFVGYVQ